MSQPLVSHWPSFVSGYNIIASQQPMAAAGNLKINYAGPPAQVIPNPATYTMPGFVRTVNLYSTEDNSALEFTITGLGCPFSDLDINQNPQGFTNQPISETISGPNNGFVFTQAIFSRVDSISVNGAVTGTVGAGYGKTGITSYQFLDVDRISWNTGYQCQYIEGSNLGAPYLEYTLYVSLTRPYDVQTQQGILTFPPQGIVANPLLVDQKTTNFGSFPSCVYIAWLNCNDDNTTSQDEIYFTTLQAGLRS